VESPIDRVRVWSDTTSRERAAVSDKVKVLHIIPRLNRGGAETMLLRLVESMDRNRFDNRVLTFTERGPIGEEIMRLGVPVDGLGLDLKTPNPSRCSKSCAGCAAIART
jgi:hypothetical protein